MKLNNLKIYCQTEQDQSNVFDFLFYEYQNEIKYATWEPDPVDTGSWGCLLMIFLLNYGINWSNILKEKTPWILDEDVEMSLNEDPNV